MIGACGRIHLGQRKLEGTIFLILALNPDFFMMSVNNGLGNEHTKSNAALIQSAALITLVEAFKDKGHIRRRNTDTLVEYADQDLFVLGVTQRQRKLAAFTREFYRIITDIIQDLIDRIAIGVGIVFGLYQRITGGAIL